MAGRAPAQRQMMECAVCEQFRVQISHERALLPRCLLHGRTMRQRQPQEQPQKRAPRSSRGLQRQRGSFAATVTTAASFTTGAFHLLDAPVAVDGVGHVPEQDTKPDQAVVKRFSVRRDPHHSLSQRFHRHHRTAPACHHSGVIRQRKRRPQGAAWCIERESPGRSRR